LLIDSVFTKKHNENLAKIKATKAFVEILKEQKLNPKDHLDAEQLELLAEDEYV
jgi:glutamate mutase epsilon subunit